MDQKKLAIGAPVLIIILFFVATGFGIANHGESKDSSAKEFEPPKWLTGIGSMNPFGDKLDTDRLQGDFKGQDVLRLSDARSEVRIGPAKKKKKKKQYVSVALELQSGAGEVAYVEKRSDEREWVELKSGEPVKLAVSSDGGMILFRLSSEQATVRLK